MSTEQTTSQDTAAQDTAPERTFHASDYQRAARLLKAMRHVRSGPYTPKGPQSQAKVNALAALFASAFSQDAEGSPEGAPFSADYFLAGTQLPEPPQDAPQASQATAELLDSPPQGDVAGVLAELDGNPWDTADGTAS